MIDLHTHLLPGLDDGPSTLDESVALAQAMVAAGTQVDVATPSCVLSLPDAPGGHRRDRGAVAS